MPCIFLPLECQWAWYNQVSPFQSGSKDQRDWDLQPVLSWYAWRWQPLWVLQLLGNECGSANNHMCLKEYSELHMTPQPQPTSWLQPDETMSRQPSWTVSRLLTYRTVRTPAELVLSYWMVVINYVATIYEYFKSTFKWFALIVQFSP